MDRSNRRIVATLTTLPDRYELLYKTIKSLISLDIKLDAIYISLPKRTKRFNTEYPELPEKIKKHCTVVDIDQDYGPITKILGALRMETDPETIILCVDDDIIYPSDLLTSYLRYSVKYPNDCICSGGISYNNGMLYSSVYNNNDNITTLNGLLGFEIPESGRSIDIVFGVSGVLYKRKFFPKYENLYEEILKYVLEDNNTFLNDDVMLSGYLSKKGIIKRIVPNIPHVENQINEGPRLSANIVAMAGSIDKSIAYLKTKNLFVTSNTSTVMDSPFFKILFILILLIILGFCIWYLYNNFPKNL